MLSWQMNEKLALILAKVIPQLVVRGARRLEFKIKSRWIRITFDRSAASPAWLEINDLEELQQVYKKPKPYSYAPDMLNKRGETKSKSLLKLLNDNNINRFLELGSNDGMVCWYLQSRGKEAVALDKQTGGLTESVRNNVKLIKADASCLPFKDESFDCIFEYNSLEHFIDPESMLREAIRVVKSGGYIYLNGGMLYMSPLGLHAFDEINIPYCQYLFSRKTIEEYSKAKGLSVYYYDTVNGWRLQQYRNLWDKYSNVLQKVRYKENYILLNCELITKHTSCFKSKTDNFDELFTHSIEVLFRKTEVK